MVVAATAGFSWFWYTHREPQPTPIRAIAVLPFENLSGDLGQDYFVDGVTDELITELARMGSVRVISRTSSMQYKHANSSLRKIASELGVNAVVEGAVARSGTRVRITAQLIRASSDQHIWANSYERDVSNILALQTEIACNRTRVACGVGHSDAHPGPLNHLSIGKPMSNTFVDATPGICTVETEICNCVCNRPRARRCWRQVRRTAVPQPRLEGENNWMVWTAVDPRWRSLHSDPQFQHLLGQIGR